MDPDYKEQRKQEYFSGTMIWNVGPTNGDHNRFTKEYLIPLRQLNGEHVFGSFDEVREAVGPDEVRTTEVVVF